MSTKSPSLRMEGEHVAAFVPIHLPTSTRLTMHQEGCKGIVRPAGSLMTDTMLGGCIVEREVLRCENIVMETVENDKQWTLVNTWCCACNSRFAAVGYSVPPKVAWINERM